MVRIEMRDSKGSSFSTEIIDAAWSMLLFDKSAISKGTHLIS